MQMEFERFVAGVRGQVDARLAAWIAARIAIASARGQDLAVVADSLGQLALRGGKRMRAVLLAAAYEGCGGEGGAEAVALAGVALELLQVYLLVHDDWMDGDAVRRGGPSVPATMRAHFAGAAADSASVLAGDLAAAWAREAILEVHAPADRVVLAARELARVEDEVVQGQLLDMTATADDLAQVEAVHALKTASYSTRGPVVMGARLAGASEATVAALAEFATPLGVAFQLRDDVLGVFGDASAMGKPAGGDLRAGRRTAVVVEALGDPEAAAAIARARGPAGSPGGTDRDVAEAIDRIARCGARARVEGRIAALVAQSRAALDRAGVAPSSRRVLGAAVVALTERQA